MTEKEKVIRGLECIAQQVQNGTCGGCAYFRPFTDDPDCGWCDKVAIENDALALLRGQEAVEPKWAIGIKGGADALCGSCMAWLSDHSWGHSWSYCPRCGRRMMWDADN